MWWAIALGMFLALVILVIGIIIGAIIAGFIASTDKPGVTNSFNYGSD